MASIDELFRKPNAPSSLTTGKRKFETPDAQAVYKSAKTSADEDVKGSRTNGSAATVEDGSDPEDIEAGPELPPEDEPDTDDDEGRFFGGGVTRNTRQAMDYLDSTDAADYIEEKIDAAWARRLASNLERKIGKNAEQRARFEGQPQKFMQSEADLDAEIKSISILTEHTEFYGEFAKAGGAAQLVSLLAHDNTDIAISAVQCIAELLEDDVEVEEDDRDALTEALVEADLISLLAQGFERYDESADESDRQGVYHSLSILEAFWSSSIDMEKAATDDIIKYLLKRIQTKEDGTSQNKQYAAEVLQVLLQFSNQAVRRTIRFGGMDIFLELVSPYRRDDPASNTSEEEYANSLFNSLVCLAHEPDSRQAFLRGEGVELMLIMLREGKMSRGKALRVLDHAALGAGRVVCERIVEAAGLKTLFGLFKKKLSILETENLLGILSAMLRVLPGESSERIRTMAKFEEKDYDKIAKLFEWRNRFISNVEKVNVDVARETALLGEDAPEEKLNEWDLRRIDSGMFGLQTANVILAWLAAEDAVARAKISAGLEAGGETIESLKANLKKQLLELDQAAKADIAEMLHALIDAL
ncbi:hypothetical protein ANO11243_010660 [Dothideomycetidae sp. 11243]|nr:hypothetical protein ANO11243_010660 [fungal sp. No.11243]